MTRRTLLFAAASPLCPDSRSSWIVLDKSGRIQSVNWPNAQQPVSFGSLLKPFLALSYLATHSQTPVVQCRGIAAGCWYPPGHGRQDLISALANSCNVYFLQLAENINRAALDATCLSFGLASPSRSWAASRLIGLGEGWPQAPVEVARAYALLARRASDSHVSTVLAGMARCARTGTARAIGFPCYAKTGTAPCSDVPRGSGDGYVLSIYSLDEPRRVVLLKRHNTTGAHAAAYMKPLITSLS